MTNVPAISRELQAKLSEKVKDWAIELLPDETFNKLVADECKAFFEDSTSTFTVTEKSGYQGRSVTKDFGVSCTPFRLLIWQELNALMGEKIRALNDKDALKSEVLSSISAEGYTELEGVLGDRWEKALNENILNIARDMFRGIFAQAVSAARVQSESDMYDHIHNGGKFPPHNNY